MDSFAGRDARTYLMGDLKGEFASDPDVTLLPARWEALLAARGAWATRGMIADAVVVSGGELCTE